MIAASDLAQIVAREVLGGDPARLLGEVSGDVPDFCDSDYLPAGLVAMWPRLSIDARLIARLMADQLCTASNEWIEHNERCD